MKSTVLVLGANGRIGGALVGAFSAAGWAVRAQVRRPPPEPMPAGVSIVTCDALDAAAIAQAAQGADVIVHALNPDYTKWDALVPPLTASVLAAARASGALLMLPGNVYNFGSELPPVLSESTPEVGNTPKARVRIELEKQLRDAARDGVRSVVIRAGDFFGAGSGSWFDLVIAKDLRRGRIVLPGPDDVAHAWAYLPDLARVFVAVAEQRARLARCATLHYAGLTLTGVELAAAFERVCGRPLERRQLPWWLLRLGAPFVPMLGALCEMRYLWRRPHRLDDTRLRALIGDLPVTGLDAALRSALGLLADPPALGGPAVSQAG
ncbi:NmrA family NAD(P)-binding protein [Niveibacterium sp. 24ML]|uniref:NmrA family NAD(P)-binding protein n=1 Tax=Niveibacterium sp. 24ML TaxID=2985512 RepID=UPI002270A4E5|nr:NAD-dependent epimerase/dehydratase family protein [Niveibacterium sp. 24ML]MCX9154978.1 NmrA family NAD(P)-binding protein [Niveibacterium sp. 24ML]